MSVVSVQRAHDALLAHKPEGVEHTCSLCQTREQAEVVEVAEGSGDRTFTETEHFALLTDAVARETASLESGKAELEGTVQALTAEKTQLESEKAELQSQIDKIEAEKVAAEKARDDAVGEHDKYVKDLEEIAAVEARKTERTAALKEVAADILDDEYFTDARVQRWAEMSDEAFEQVVADMRDLAAKAQKKPTNDEADDQAAADKAKAEKAARETAAFTGGESPTTGNGSVLSQYLTATGRMPAVAS